MPLGFYLPPCHFGSSHFGPRTHTKTHTNTHIWVATLSVYLGVVTQPLGLSMVTCAVAGHIYLCLASKARGAISSWPDHVGF